MKTSELVGSIAYMEKLIKKFNDNGDYYIGDELSWALDGLNSAKREIDRLNGILKTTIQSKEINLKELEGRN